MRRPPIVVVMGHVDHGKTTLLDFIRKTNTATKEAGGITQSIGAYEITHHSQKITFIDTPGHEAFSRMRARGARIADVAILVVAADDGVKPQTKDALHHILSEKIPFVVAINKIDKPGVDADKTKNELMQAGVFLEGYGGDVSYQAISAKTGEGVHELLDLVLLTSEMQSLECDPHTTASGIVITGQRDAKRGVVVGAILTNGALKMRDMIATEGARGKVKILEDSFGKTVTSLEPSAPFLVFGFEELPRIGDKFIAGDEKIVGAMIHGETPTVAHIPTAKQLGSSLVPLILKADEVGSLEVLLDVVKNIPPSQNRSYTSIHSSVGNIHESDVKLAMNSKAVIVAFRSKPDRGAENLIKVHGVLLIQSPIIYEIDRALKMHLLGPASQGVPTVEVLALFGTPKGSRQIVGGKVLTGPVLPDTSFEVWYQTKMLGKGTLTNIRQAKDNIAQAEMGRECGFLVESEVVIQVGYRLVFV